MTGIRFFSSRMCLFTMSQQFFLILKRHGTILAFKNTVFFTFFEEIEIYPHVHGTKRSVSLSFRLVVLCMHAGNAHMSKYEAFRQ